MKVYHRGQEKVRALSGVSLAVDRGELVAVTGPSGSGKTTLLQLIGCLDKPTSGYLGLLGRDTTKLSDRDLTQVRRDRIGFVFQHFSLLPNLTVLENVQLPSLFGKPQIRERARDLLERVGLSHRLRHRPSQISGGEMQRAAIARALMNSPDLLLADEPTGNLDTTTSGSVLELLAELNREGLTIVVVTHNEQVARLAGRRICLLDGTIAPHIGDP